MRHYLILVFFVSLIFNAGTLLGQGACKIFEETFNGSSSFTGVANPYGQPPSLCASAQGAFFSNDGSADVLIVGTYHEGELRRNFTLPSDAYRIKLTWRFQNDGASAGSACGGTNYDDKYGLNCVLHKRVVIANGNTVLLHKPGAFPEAVYNETFTHNGPINSMYIGAVNYCSINEYLFTYVDNLLIEVPKPTADYTYIVDELKVKFTNNSNSGNTYLWEFGNDSTSTLKNPEFSYTDTGTYNVCLTTKNSCGEAKICKQIQVNCLKTEALYDYKANGLTVQFLDSSRNAEIYKWTFGDGGKDSISNPTHTYNETGLFMVCLETENHCSKSSYCNYVVVDSASGIGAFSAGNLNIWPNPVRSGQEIQIRSGQPGLVLHEMSILDARGGVVFGGSRMKGFMDSNVTVLLPELTPGSYWVKLGYAKGKTGELTWAVIPIQAKD